VHCSKYFVAMIEESGGLSPQNVVRRFFAGLLMNAFTP